MTALYYYKEGLINVIKPDQRGEAKVLQETLVGQFGEMRTMMQYFFQSYGPLTTHDHITGGIRI